MMRKRILIMLVLTLALTGCIVEPGMPGPELPAPTAPAENASESIAVYFSDPEDPNAGSYRGGPDTGLAKAIREAEFSVDAAIYHLNLWSIRDALIAAHEAGVEVRVVAESDNLDEIEIQEVREAGIEVLGDRREGLMHNKFVVIDGHEVWTGSMNFTVNGAYRNDNNLVQVQSSKLAENYTAEFNEMFEDDYFGDDTLASTPNPSLNLNGVQVETCFSPDDGCAAEIIAALEAAEERVQFLAFAFTSDPIAETLIDLAGQNVAVQGVFEESQYYSNTGGEFDHLDESGLDVRLDGNPRNMHHKVFIIDGETVITGSYNFSRSAEVRNDENLLIIHSPEIAAQYLVEFERIWAQTEP